MMMVVLLAADACVFICTQCVQGFLSCAIGRQAAGLWSDCACPYTLYPKL